jgi:alginate O-acetyltransferase complex protein AlgI
MLFPSYIFVFAFAPVAILGFWLIKPPFFRRLWLAAMSYIFYGYWDWRFTSLLLISSALNFFTSILIEKSPDEKDRKMWMVVAVIGNLGMIGFFKYFMLFANSINFIVVKTGLGDGFNVMHVILPIGISFFTFQAMSYTIDVYRRKIDATYDFIEFAAYLALFPQLIAGPIVRYAWVYKTLRNLPDKLGNRRFNLGMFFFVFGLVKKVLIADSIARYIDPMFLNYSTLVPIEAWMCMIGYSLQLYFDFSGYSLMAIGLGHLLGFEFPQNFDSPYKAVSISDFWRRWHITLSTWLRDYLYIPLGGRNNRAIALAVTMLLGGLWHGAYWTYVVWGAYHAFLLEVHHHMKHVKWIPRNLIYAQIGTFFVATIGWVFFRPPTFEVSWAFFTTMFDVVHFFDVIPKFDIGFILLVIVGLYMAMIAPNAYELVHIKLIESKKRYAFVMGILAMICVLYMSQSGPFLYFQF